MTTHPTDSGVYVGELPTTGHVLAGLLACGHAVAYLYSEVQTPEPPLLTTTTPFGPVVRWEAMTPSEWREAQDAMIAASTLLEQLQVPHPLGGTREAGRIVHDRCDGGVQASPEPPAPTPVAPEPARSLADIAAEQLVDPEAPA